MKTKNILIGFVTFVMIMTSTYAFAQQGTPQQNRDDRGYNRPYRFQNLNLTDAQRDQLEAEHRAFFTAMQPYHQDLRAKRLELAAELAKKNPDAKRAAALQKEISDLDATLGQKQLEHALIIHKLSPDVGRNCCGYGFGGGGYGYDGGYGPHCKDGRWKGSGWRHHR
ncbi:periplasmic heavy metal sensor [Desulfosarcina sp. OttesenSCG-928-A07]|nr:periplasmic heavy metal sensor [Desulfosarcina sp. OttesenSCG-928-G17]MDL2330101.1 periplasmic heavy metal sensor [Desulfosarcina sp. OttesenSCG-928-A07]